MNIIGNNTKGVMRYAMKGVLQLIKVNLGNKIHLFGMG